MVKGYRIERFEDVSIFAEKMKNFDENTIECTEHTFFRLSEKQRKVFTCDTLKSFLLSEIPLRVGIQYNLNYAAFYKYKEGNIIKIVISFKPIFIRIVTFMILGKEQLPR